MAFSCLVVLALLVIAVNAQTPDEAANHVHAAVLLKRVAPDHPKKARKEHVEGTVRIHAVIAKDGSVKDLEVVSGDPLLMDAALKAVRQWRYQPTMLNGEPVDVSTTIHVAFRLNKSS